MNNAIDKSYLDSLPPWLSMARGMIPAKHRQAIDMAGSIVISVQELKEDEKNALLHALHKALAEVVPTFSEESLSNKKVIGALTVLDQLLTESGKS